MALMVYHRGSKQLRVKPVVTTHLRSESLKARTVHHVAPGGVDGIFVKMDHLVGHRDYQRMQAPYALVRNADGRPAGVTDVKRAARVLSAYDLESYVVRMRQFPITKRRSGPQQLVR